MVINRSVRSPNGIGRSAMAFTSEKIVTLAPMPIATVNKTAIRKTGLWVRPRHACRRSRRGAGMDLFLAKRDGWLDARRAPRRHPGRREDRSRERHRHRDKQP